MSFARARRIADAVLYEGYVLYPYRASARKNRIRWQFGVLAPRSWCEAGGAGGSESWWMLTECLVEDRAPLAIFGCARFLQVQERRIEKRCDSGSDRFERVATLEADGRLWTEWDEGIEREVEFDIGVPADDPAVSSAGMMREILFSFPGSREVEPILGADGSALGRTVRERRAVAGALIVGSRPVEGAAPLSRVSVRIE